MTEAAILTVGVLLGWLLCSWQVRPMATQLAERQKQLDAECQRLDARSIRLLDLTVARTAAEAAELEQAHADAERPRPTPAPPPAWTRDPRVQTHPGRVVQHGNLLQLRVGPKGDERVKQQFELDATGGIVAETFTPRNPAGA